MVRMPKVEMEIMAHMARREMAFVRQPTPSRDWWRRRYGPNQRELCKARWRRGEQR